MMWGKVFDVIKRFLTITEKLNSLQRTSELHAEQIRELFDNQTRFQYELQLQKERDARERERILHQLQMALKDRAESELRLENRQLREHIEKSERSSLPPSTSIPPDEPSKD